MVYFHVNVKSRNKYFHEKTGNGPPAWKKECGGVILKCL